MSVTVRLWSQEDLDKAVAGDKWLITLLANKTTYNEAEIQAFNKVRSQVKRYCAIWDGDFDSITDIHATDDETLLKFLDADYTSRPQEVTEVITTYRELNSSFLQSATV